MNCQNCDAPIDAQKQACDLSTPNVAAGCEKTKSSNLFWLVTKILIWLSPFVLLFFALWPAVTGYHVTPAIVPVMTRGREIHLAIMNANKDREPLGLPPLWPRTCGSYTNHPGDISSKIFMTSSDYFYVLYDGLNVGASNHQPYVIGFDYSKLAGAGVPAKVGAGRLTADNNMWLIAANVTPDDSELIPLLVTRNVDVKEIERAINYGITTNDFKTRIFLGKGGYKTPFGSATFGSVHKGGRMFSCKARWATLGTLFDNKELPPRDPSKPPIVYLMP
jgi:hypothetical protein